MDRLPAAKPTLRAVPKTLAEDDAQTGSPRRSRWRHPPGAAQTGWFRPGGDPAAPAATRGQEPRAGPPLDRPGDRLRRRADRLVPGRRFRGDRLPDLPVQDLVHARGPRRHDECAWVMPFAERAVIRLHNVSDQPVHIPWARLAHGDWKWDDRSMHFHATWRQLTEVDRASPEGHDGQGRVRRQLRHGPGRGLYVGDTLTVFNGAAAWWGEGDEKILRRRGAVSVPLRDGHREDYYGYAWCRPEFFDAPFHAQPDGGGNLAGGFSVNSRYRALDAIPFTSRSSSTWSSGTGPARK